ncbi:MAG: hypothetical protein M3O99_08505 [Chloroflexota bacterium]|nr:hypothetical protein [Chloroflexota bacterium]
MLAVVLAAWSFSTEPLYAAIAERRLALPIGEAVVFAPLSIVLAALAFRGGTRSLRAVSIIAGLLAIGEIPAGIFATTDPSIWWKIEPECGIVYCGLLHSLAHWSHVPFLIAIALAARSAGANRPPDSSNVSPWRGL